MMQLKLILKLIIAVVFLSGLFACDEEEDRFEVVNKLRAIGVKAEPGITSPSGDETKLVNLTVYALLPEGGEIDSIAPYSDEGSGFSLPAVGVTISDDQSAYEELARLRLASFPATIPVPTADNLDFEAFNDVVRFRFGVTITSGAESENVVNDFLVVPEDDESLNLQVPSITIVKPANGESLTKGAEVDIEAGIEKGDENIKIGWYVSGGKVENRRAKETKWTVPDETGSHTLLVGIYSSKTRTFSYQSITVEVTE